METLTHSHVGAYDMTCSRELAWDPETGLGVLIEDSFGGMEGIHGGAYRPHLYCLSAELAASAREAWDDATPTEAQLAKDDFESAWEAWSRIHCEELMHGRRYDGTAKAALARHLKRQAVKA